MDKKEHKKNVICPACGSSDVKMKLIENEMTEPYGTPIRITTKVYTCSVCNMEGDFTGDNDQVIENAVDTAKKNSLAHILEHFHENKISMAAIERSLDLPQRTLTKWKSGASTPSATGFALMNIVMTYPWILDVAQRKYDPIVAKQLLINNAVSELVQAYQYQTGYTISAGIIPSSESIVFYAGICKENTEPNNYVCDMGNIPTHNVTVTGSVSAGSITIAGGY